MKSLSGVSNLVEKGEDKEMRGEEKKKLNCDRLKIS